MTFFIIGMTLFMTTLIGVMAITKDWEDDRAAMKKHLWRPDEPITEFIPVVRQKELPKGARPKKTEDLGVTL